MVGADDDLREREVEALEMSAQAERDAARGAVRSSLFQAIATAIAGIATALAVWGLVFTADQVELTRQSLERQSVNEYRKGLDDRLSSAIEAVGRDDPAGRIAGITLLQRNARARIELADRSSEQEVRDDAVGTYGLVVDVIETYLRDPGLIPQSASYGPGWGVPPAFAPERAYVTDRLRTLLGSLPEVNALAADDAARPAIDLTGAQLYRTSWRGVDVSLLRGRTFTRVDLRGSLLNLSDFTESEMRGAHLQCANFSGSEDAHAELDRVMLQGAHMRGSDLSFADLSGANLQGADLRDTNLFGADLTGAKIDSNTNFLGAYGTENVVGQKLGPGKPGTFSLTGCLANRTFDSPKEAG